MKKLLSLLFVVLILVSSLALIVNAETVITVSDDLSTATVDGETYSRYNSNSAEIIYADHYGDHYGDSRDALLSKKQKETIKSIKVMFADENNVAIEVTVNYLDGSTLSTNFLNDKNRDEYEKFINGESKKTQVDLEYPYDNQVTIEKSALLGERMEINKAVKFYSEEYAVREISEDENFYHTIGVLMIYDTEYYFVDFSELNTTYNEFYASEYECLEGYKIVDKTLLKDLKSATKESYEDSFGFFLDDKFTKIVSNVFLIGVFGVIPLIILALFVILAVKSKTALYRKMFTVICSLSVLELVMFIIMFVYLLLI